MDRRYPIGKYEQNGAISAAQRETWIQAIEGLPNKLQATIHNLSHEQIDMSYREGGWTIRQVVHHLADSHMNSFIRFKLALTENTPVVKPYYEERWADLSDSVSCDVDLSVNLIEALHMRWGILLRSMTDNDFNRSFYHPELQQEIRLDYSLGKYAWHGNHHLAQIQLLL